MLRVRVHALHDHCRDHPVLQTMLMFLLKALSVFAISAVVDICWALYLRRAGTGHATKAAHFATLLMGLGIYNTHSWLSDKRLIIPMLVGGWLGTYYTIKHDKRKNG